MFQPALLVVGIILNAIGAVRIGYNDVIDRPKANRISAMHLDDDVPAVEELLRRSRNSKVGLAFMIIGSALLVLAAILPKITTQSGTA